MAGQSGFGATITTAFTGIGLVRSISWTGVTGETIDISSNANTNRWREFARAMADGGTVQVSAIYEDNDANLESFVESTTLGLAAPATAFTVTLPDPAGAAGTAIVFSGLATALDVSAPYDDVMTVEYSVKVSGIPAITP